MSLWARLRAIEKRIVRPLWGYFGRDGARLIRLPIANDTPAPGTRDMTESDRADLESRGRKVLRTPFQDDRGIE